VTRARATVLVAGLCIALGARPTGAWASGYVGPPRRLAIAAQRFANAGAVLEF
jgi:hypothetical protein